KIASALVDYFPVPRDMKGQALRFAPRGKLTNAMLTWSGEAGEGVKTYALRGQFEDLAINPVDRFPGVSGLSGELEGTEAGGTPQLSRGNAPRAPAVRGLSGKTKGREAGGTLPLTGRTAVLEQAEVFRAPLTLETLDAR